MPLLLEPRDVSITYLAEFKEPQIEQVREDSRITLAQKLITKFNLRLNDIKYDVASISDKYVKFSKFYGRTFLDVSFGLEQIFATLNNPSELRQIKEIFFPVFDLFEGFPIKSQRFGIQQQCSTKEDFGAFIGKLSPYSPLYLKDVISGRGITYHLNLKEDNLAAFVTVSDSLFIDKGAFVFVQFDFSPNKYDPQKTFELAQTHFNFILKGLDLSVLEA